MGIIDEIRSIDPESIDFDDKKTVKNLIVTLLNIVEELLQSNQQLKEKVQELKDEINHLKGEKGKPKFKPNVPLKENNVYKEKNRKEWKKRSKKQRVGIDRIEVVDVDKDGLPTDSVDKGHKTFTVQNIKFQTDNVEYRLKRYYSPSKKKTYTAELPEGVDGHFGPGLKAFIHTLYFACRVSENKIHKLLIERGIIISEGQISNILIKEKQEEFTKEKEEIFKAGMECTDYFHTDDTGARHKGLNYYTHVICTQFFSAFFIRPRKNKDTIRDILGLKDGEKINKAMMSDDARQFLNIAILHMLCWIHEIRHFRKLNPFLEWHHKKLVWFLTEVWKFYEMLKEYKKSPNEQQKIFLEQKFDELFSTKTGYKELDRRIELTRQKKERLLLVLEYPWIPLHNNPAEIALRELVIKRKISYGTRSEDGIISLGNMMTLEGTCKKNNISFMDYTEDIFSGRYRMPRLCTIIRENAMANSTSY